MVSCTGSRYSSEAFLQNYKSKNIDSVSIDTYYSLKYKYSDTSLNKKELIQIITNPIIIHLNENSDKSLNNDLNHFLEIIPNSTEIPYSQNELIKFKKNYLQSNSIDTLNVDSLYNLPISVQMQRNLLSYRYGLTIYFSSQNNRFLTIWKSNDNTFTYSFCCKNDNDWFVNNLKGYYLFSKEYVLDIEFQKRFVRLFNDILTKYNETNGTDYPLLDVDYEVWSGIIRDH